MVYESNFERNCIITSYILAVLAIFLVLQLKLLPCLLAGMITFEIIDVFQNKTKRFIRTKVSNLIAVTLIMLVIISFFLGAAMIAYHIVHMDFTSEGEFYQKLNHIFSEAKNKLYPVLGDYTPRSYQDVENAMLTWLEKNIFILKSAGRGVLHFFVITFIGIFIAILIHLTPVNMSNTAYNLKYYIMQRIYAFKRVFSAIVSAQIKVAVFNAIATGIFLYFIMPLMGFHLPYVKTLTFVTFLCSLLPIIGNLISNTLISLVALSISINAVIVTIFYMIILHKFEYFINARIVGAKIKSSIWEVILAMFFLESLFGIAGLVAAPIFYAWLKFELTLKGII